MNRLGLLLVAAAVAGCGGRVRPHRFGSPMLGHASVPPVPLPGEAPARPALANRAPGPDRSVRAAPIRITIAPPIREASAAAAAAIASETPVARADTRAQLAAPHRLPSDEPLPEVRASGDLRALVGRRDPGDPLAATLGWARDLGVAVEGDTGGELVAWAERASRLRPPTEAPERGDLLVFDRAVTGEAADLVAIVIARDERSVTEFLYLGNGVIRRGFVDASRPNVKRDATGAIVNTFLRTGRRWPPKGTRYLAGELLAHVIRAR